LPEVIVDPSRVDPSRAADPEVIVISAGAGSKPGVVRESSLFVIDPRFRDAVSKASDPVGRALMRAGFTANRLTVALRVQIEKRVRSDGQFPVRVRTAGLEVKVL
jgi:hypothetical protein